jgi:hypothetical protein
VLRIFKQSQRNCLENSPTHLDHVFLVTQSGNWGTSRLVLAPRGTPLWSLFGFTKQFQRVCSRKLPQPLAVPAVAGRGTGVIKNEFTEH